MYSYSQSSSLSELSNRCKKLENEITLQKKFNQEFYPTPPKRIKKTRWNFDLLNMENQQIQEMARKAFDPFNCFLPIVPASNEYEYQDSFDENYNESKMKLPISTPHRVADPNVYYRKRKMQMRQKEEDERAKKKENFYDRLEQRKNLIIEYVEPKSGSFYNNNSSHNSMISNEPKFKQRKKTYHDASSSKSKTSNSDFDSTIEQFVDKIDDYKKW